MLRFHLLKASFDFTLDPVKPEHARLHLGYALTNEDD